MRSNESTRRNLAAVFVCLLLAVSSSRSETLTIATYNVENYVAANRMTESGYRQDYPKPESQKRALRTVLLALGADILVLQEMGGEAYLTELRRDLKQAGLDYPFAVLLEADDVDRHVALLSKRPIASITRYTTLEFSYFEKKERVKRGLLEARFPTSGGELAIFGLHLKSRFTDRSDDPRSSIRRSGEAGAIRDVILQQFPEPESARFVVLGDFNDDKSSTTMKRLFRRGKTVVAQLMPAVDSRGESWTHAYAKEESYSRVDYVLVSAGLRSGGAVRSARVYDGEGVRDASDHRPVVLTLVMPDSPAP